MMLSTRRWLLASLLVAGSSLGARPAEAQLLRASSPGYPNVGLYNPPNFNVNTYSNFGSPLYSGTGYGIGNGQVGFGYRAANTFNRPAVNVPLTRTDFTPLYNAITSLPSWNTGTSSVRRPRPRPTVPRSELLSIDGTILWPSAAPETAKRKLAEASVREVVRQSRDLNQAQVRQVTDARNKLTDYARETLPGVKTRNAADAAGLERFIVELEKTLPTMAVHY